MLGPCQLSKESKQFLTNTIRAQRETVEEIIDHDLEDDIKNKLIFTFFTYDDLKEVTIMDHHDLEENILINS